MWRDTHEVPERGMARIGDGWFAVRAGEATSAAAHLDGRAAKRSREYAAWRDLARAL